MLSIRFAVSLLRIVFRWQRLVIDSESNVPLTRLRYTTQNPKPTRSRNLPTFLAVHYSFFFFFFKLDATPLIGRTRGGTHVPFARFFVPAFFYTEKRTYTRARCRRRRDTALYTAGAS